MTTFASYLDRQLERDDPIGDLARDAARDPYFPRSAVRIESIRAYLTDRDADSAVLAALEAAWAEFTKETTI